MMIIIWAWVMILVFLVLTMRKVLHPFTAIVLVPIAFTIGGAFLGLFRDGAASTLGVRPDEASLFAQIQVIGQWSLDGLAQISSTVFMMLFAILFFSLMLDIGLFDPVSNMVIRAAKGDPFRVIVGTGVLTFVVSLSGDGTTTTLICCAALVPIYKKLKLRLLYLAVILVLMNTILNILPWSSPAARVLSVLEGIDPQEMLYAIAPGMTVATVWVFLVCCYLGMKERRRLGIQTLSEHDIAEMTLSRPEGKDRIGRGRMTFSAILTIVVLVVLIAGVFEPAFTFLIGSVITLVVNYPRIAQMKAVVSEAAPDMILTCIVVMGAGVFAGVFGGSGMSAALATSLTEVVPDSFGPHWALITALVSAPGGFFLSNDAFFFGVLPVLATAGAEYGFSPLDMGVASLMGQAFHLFSPFTPWIYLLLEKTEQPIGDWQKEGLKWATGIFAAFIALTAAVGALPLGL